MIAQEMHLKEAGHVCCISNSSTPWETDIYGLYPLLMCIYKTLCAVLLMQRTVRSEYICVLSLRVNSCLHQSDNGTFLISLISRALQRYKAFDCALEKILAKYSKVINAWMDFLF